MIDIEYKWSESQFCIDRVGIYSDNNVLLANLTQPNLTQPNLTQNGHNLAINSIEKVYVYKYTKEKSYMYVFTWEHHMYKVWYE